jgi:uncharacterized protein with GYD domain
LRGGKRNMPTFIVLGKYTKEGIENIKDSPKRLAEAKKLAKSLGGDITSFHYTFGQYDFVATTEGVSLEDTLRMAFILGMKGAIRTETLVAFSAEHAAKEVIDKLP